MNREINVCIVGLGRAGTFHLNSISNLARVNLQYVVDPKITHESKSLLDPTKTKLLDQLDEALEDTSLDAVIIASPTSMHFDHITQSLEAGKHVFAEKPMGKSVEEIRKCYALSKVKQMCLFLGFQRRYDNNFLALKERIAEIGPVRIVKATSRDNPKPTIEFLKLSGNIFHDMLIHDFDMLIHLLGLRMPKTIFAMGHSYDQEIAALGDYDTVVVTLKYAGGLMCVIDTSRISVYGYDQRIELFGVDGMAIADNQRENTLQVHSKAGTLKSPIDYSFPERYQASYLKEIKHFIQSVIGGDRYNVTESECLLSHMMVEAAQDSASKNQVIDFQAFYDTKLKTH